MASKNKMITARCPRESWGKNIERYFTIREAAVILRRHERTVWRWTVENKIEFHQPYPGCKILIPEGEINRLRPRDE